jgi:hypothetical protein
LKNITFASKNLEIRYTWLVTDKELIRFLLQELVEIETVSGMTYCVDCLCPKLIRGLLFIKHSSCHLYESTILLFGHPILLRGIGAEISCLILSLSRKSST